VVAGPWATSLAPMARTAGPLAALLMHDIQYIHINQVAADHVQIFYITHKTNLKWTREGIKLKKLQVLFFRVSEWFFQNWKQRAYLSLS